MASQKPDTTVPGFSNFQSGHRINFESITKTEAFLISGGFFTESFFAHRQKYGIRTV
jgi:hypothetical protein